MQRMNIWCLGTGAIAAAVACATASAGVPGDECTNAVTAVVGTNTFNTTNATPSANPPEDGPCTFLDWNDSKDVWFVWTPGDAGLATFDFCGSSFDTSVVIYTGTCANLVRVACDDDSCPGGSDFQSYLADFGVQANTTYYIRIGGWQAASGAGQFVLSFQPVTGDCANAKGDCGQPHGGVGCNDPVCCDAVCAQDPLCCEFGFGWDQNCVNAAVQICGIFNYNCPPGGPANDCAPNATVVVDGSVVAFNTNNANTDGPNHAECNSASNDLPIHKDVWYRFVSPANGVAIASNCSTANFDSKIAAYDVGDWASFNPQDLPDLFVACNEDGDGCDFFTSRLEFPVVAGRTYLVRLGGYLGESGTGTISFTLPEPCQLPKGNAIEAEECGTDANGGCNSPNTDVQQIEIGDVVSGTFWADNDLRDTDWYEFEVTEASTVTLSVFSSSLTTVFLLNDSCANTVILATGAGECPRVASACLTPGTYRAFVAPAAFDGLPCGSGAANSYVASLTAVPAICPVVLGTTCANPGPDSATINNSLATAGGLVACAVAGPAGGTTVNSYARVFQAGTLGGEISCLEFGIWSVRVLAAGNFASDIPLPGSIGIYKDLDGGDPRFKTINNGADGGDLVEIATRQFFAPGGVYKAVLNFEEPLCIEEFDGFNLVVILDLPNLLAGTPEVPAASGYQIRPSGNNDGPGGNTFVRLSCADGAGQYVPSESLGATFTAQWVVVANGDFSTCGGGGTPCPADLDGDGSVGASDLAILLGAWGGSGPADLDGDNTVGASDLAILLGAWGPCPQ